VVEGPGNPVKRSQEKVQIFFGTEAPNIDKENVFLIKTKLGAQERL